MKFELELDYKDGRPEQPIVKWSFTHPSKGRIEILTTDDLLLPGDKPTIDACVFRVARTIIECFKNYKEQV